MSGEVRHVEILLREGTAEATFQGERIAASSPVELWQKLGAVAGGGLLHLLPHGARSVRSEQAAAGIAAHHAVGAIGRVTYAGGAISPLIRRTEALRYLDLPAGSLIVDARALAACAHRIQRPWDRYWPHDLALALSQDGILAVANDVVADVGEAAPKSHRLPFARASLEPPAAPIILVYGRVTASTSLYFDGLPADIAARLRFLEPGDLFSDLPWLCSADLIVIVRGFEHALATGAVDLLEEIGTPMLWFTDDDFMALAAEVPSLGYYTSETVRRFTRRMSGVGITSPHLAKTMASYHDTILTFPCVLDRDLWLQRAPAATPPRGAVFGGPFRRNSFINDVLPAAHSTGLEVYATTHLTRGLTGVHTVRIQDDFRRFILEWQRIAPVVALHPYGETANIANKSLGSILVAGYLGAIPIVGDEPAYAELGEAEGVLKADPNSGSWEAQIARVLDERTRERLTVSFRSWVESTFDAERARPVFTALSELAARGRDPDSRLAAALESRTLQRALPRQPAWRRHVARLGVSLERRLARLRRQ